MYIFISLEFSYFLIVFALLINVVIFYKQIIIIKIDILGLKWPIKMIF